MWMIQNKDWNKRRVEEKKESNVKECMKEEVKEHYGIYEL